MTIEELKEVIKRVPELTDCGIGVELDTYYSETERFAAFRRSRLKLLESGQTCAKVCAWLENIVAIDSISRNRDSADLRQLAERAIGEPVSNGVFIAAAIHCGFKFKVVDDSLNARFGMSEPSVKRAGLKLI